MSFLMPFLCQLSLVSQDLDRPASNMADFPQPDGRSEAEAGAKLADSTVGQGGVGFWLSQSATWFLLCRRLTTLSRKARMERSKHRTLTSRGVSKITHLCFTDNNIMFWHAIMRVPKTPRTLATLGQKINWDKTNISILAKRGAISTIFSQQVICGK